MGVGVIKREENERIVEEVYSSLVEDNSSIKVIMCHLHEAVYCHSLDSSSNSPFYTFQLNKVLTSFNLLIACFLTLTQNLFINLLYFYSF